MHRLNFTFHGIGDQVATTPIPEAYFGTFGEKVVLCDERIWAFKYNPYVVFEPEGRAARYPVLDLVPDCREEEQMKHYAKARNALAASSQADYMCLSLGIGEPRLRHPRLYVYEDARIVPAKVVVHTTGTPRAIRDQLREDTPRVMSDDVIASVLANYADWQIVQVGGERDKPLGGHAIDRRGQYDYWETAREIASAARFVGVNSGPMHIANCYPRVDKRIVLMEFPAPALSKFRPGDIRNWLFSWLDPGCTFFNRFDYDVGVTYSHQKI
jgi:hypothetical protein